MIYIRHWQESNSQPVLSQVRLLNSGSRHSAFVPCFASVPVILLLIFYYNNIIINILLLGNLFITWTLDLLFFFSFFLFLFFLSIFLILSILSFLFFLFLISQHICNDLFYAFQIKNLLKTGNNNISQMKRLPLFATDDVVHASTFPPSTMIRW